jgi:LuxR family maltose regulon positive regulatory protein
MAAQRFMPPRQLTTLIERAALLRELTENVGNVTVLLGLPGSGKTTLLATSYRAMLEDGKSAQWLTLSVEHNDPDRLRADLNRLFVGNEDSEVEEHLQIPAGITVYIDGLDRVTSPTSADLLDVVMLSVPNDARVIASSVKLRGAALTEARLRGVVRVIGPDCLRFERSEASQLLGEHFNEVQVDRILRLVDGWVAGLHFFREERAQLEDADAAIPLPTAMIEYFDEVIRPRLDTTTFQTLAQLAVLERFPPALLRALPESPCAWDWVEEHIRAGYFLSYTNAAREWVVFHPAFGRYLRRYFRFSMPEQHDRIKQFAALWFEEYGYGAEAVRHALALPEVADAARVVEKVGALDILQGLNSDSGNHRFLPPDRAGEQPMLFIAQTYERIRRGRFRQAEAAFEQACAATDEFTQLRSDSDPAIVKAWARTLRLVFSSTSDRPISALDANMLDTEMKRHQDQHPVLAGSIASVLAFIHLDSARFAEAIAVCDAGLATQPASLDSSEVMWIRLQQADAMLARNCVTRAKLCIEHACQLAQREANPDSYEVLATQLMHGVVLYENDHLDAALALILPALEKVRTINGWLRLYAESYSAAAAAFGRRNGLEAAEQIIRAGEAFARERDLPRLQQFLNIARLRERMRAGDWTSAKSLLESDAFKPLIESEDNRAFLIVQKRPALLEAAQLTMHLGQPRETLGLLKRLDPAFIAEGENRQRLRYHVLMMRAQHALRRPAAAVTHWLNAIEIAQNSELRRAIREDARHLLDIHDALSARIPTVPGDTGTLLADLRSFAQEDPISANVATSASIPKKDLGCALSPREYEIMVLLAQGMINKEIANHLGISEGTVKTHRKKAHEKLGVSTRSQAIARARELLIL